MNSHGIPIRNVWLLMLYASDLLRTSSSEFRDIEDMPADLPDIIARLLVESVEERLRRNLHRAYEPRKAVLNRVRGRIDVLTTETRQLLRQGKIACRFDDLTIDTTRNRYVKGALESIAGKVNARELGHQCSGLARRLRSMGVSGHIPSMRQVSADRFSRHDVNDRFMVEVARLAFDLTMPSESRGIYGLVDPSRDEHWLRKLFERAVYGFYRFHLQSGRDWLVSRGRVLKWPVVARSSGIDAILPRMETDIELLHRPSGRKIVIDTKFTSILKPSHYRHLSIKSEYLYQIYAYLHSQVTDSTLQLPEGVLLHPTTDGHVDEAAFIQGHILRFSTVNLAGKPSEFRDDLMRIVESYPSTFQS